MLTNASAAVVVVRLRDFFRNPSLRLDDVLVFNLVDKRIWSNSQLCRVNGIDCYV